MNRNTLPRSASLARSLPLLALVVVFLPSPLSAKTVVFWQPGFPTVASEPIDRAVLDQALEGMDPQFLDLRAMNDPAALADAGLLVLPYGSAVPGEAWKAIESYLHAGGDLLVLGGQPLHVPVNDLDGKFVAASPENTYAGQLALQHTYEVPVPDDAHFAWKPGYDFSETPQVRARRFFAVEGRLNGLGYMVNSEGALAAAPVIVCDHTFGPERGSRIVALDFEPEPGYWQTRDGIALVRQSALYASQGVTRFSVELLFGTVRPGEPPLITVHLRSLRQQQLGVAASADVKLTLSSSKGVIDSATLPIADSRVADVVAPFRKVLDPGFYRVSAVLTEGGHLREFYQNGFWVSETAALAQGPVLAVKGDFLTRDGAPFFPVGTNYFTTENGEEDFSGPRNAWFWDKDFAEMERHGVTFVRTGVWMPSQRFVDANTGAANERLLRNLEAFLHCAQQHNIAVNFTFFAFVPRTGLAAPADPNVTMPNPYTDPAQLQLEQAYVRSVVERFKDVPWLTWDLINEPSFSNPRHIFKGNYPNGDPTEIVAWRAWLRQNYDGDPAALALAWGIPPEDLAGFDAIPLPAAADLTPSRSGNLNEIRALDYNLFAQDEFIGWVHSMVGLLRGLGSQQLIDIGQDEGGVLDRVLNQFYAGAGVSFTTNHTYWQDDALLWDSVAAKRIGVPNITGETGYQPVWSPDGAWRYDELTGVDLIERKWALGFAAGSTGAMQWDWGRDPDFGMLRSDGSAKIWEDRMKQLGDFARKAAPFGTGIRLPEVAIVLPQSFQLSVGNQFAITAQQNVVRALYGYARADAYAVGEYQPELLGSPRLILLPSPMELAEPAWQAIEDRVKAGAVLLVTGPFAADPHFHVTNRPDEIGLAFHTEPLTIREHLMHFPAGDEQLSFSGSKTTYLSRAVLPGGEDWMERPLGKGRILFSPLPLELNDNLQALGDVYRYALKAAGVTPAYTTALKDPGILICPTRYPEATLYVITSESNQTQVNFVDLRSGRRLAGKLASGRAAIVLVSADGRLLASYNWSGS